MTKTLFLSVSWILILSALAIVLRVWTPWGKGGVRGIDVSHHQGKIDWNKVARNDVAFTYIKATEGGDFVDPKFTVNWRAARKAGISVGAYHFFTLCRPPELHAANFLNVTGHDRHDLPPALDLEHMGPCEHGPTLNDPASAAIVFLDKVEAELGIRPIIYTTRQFHDAHLQKLKGERYWLRSLFFAPEYRQRSRDFWQHHNRGHVDGIEGPVDLNEFRGSHAEFLSYVSRD